MSRECNNIVQTEREDGARGFIPDDRVLKLSNYSVMRLDISGYVTAVNSQPVSG
jgi:uncharacterized FlgJ-related protein